MQEPKIFTKLKSKWGIKSNWDFFIINVVFALAGMSIVFVRKPVFALLGITTETALWIKVLVYIPLIIPTYQINLLFFGFILGQFKFFWEKEKQVGRFLLSIFTQKGKKASQPVTPLDMH